MLTAGAGCGWPLIPGDPGTGETGGGVDGVREVDVVNCSPKDPINFPDEGEQFVVWKKLSTDSDWTLVAQIQADCFTTAQAQLDQPGNWQVRAIGMRADESNCHSGDSTSANGQGCLDVLEKVFNQNPEGPIATWQIQ